jgi:hypothetical protein
VETFFQLASVWITSRLRCVFASFVKCSTWNVNFFYLQLLFKAKTLGAFCAGDCARDASLSNLFQASATILIGLSLAFLFSWQLTLVSITLNHGVESRAMFVKRRLQKMPYNERSKIHRRDWARWNSTNWICAETLV